MSTKMAPEDAALWTAAEKAIIQERDAFLEVILKGLAAYGVVVDPDPLNGNCRTTRCKYFELISKKPDLEGWSEEYTFEVQSQNWPYFHKPSAPQILRHLPFLRYGTRGRKRTYTRLATVTYRKILIDMETHIKEFIARKKSLQDVQQVRHQWAALKQATLGSMVIPPSLEVKLWAEATPPTPETVPSFSIQLRPGHHAGLNRAHFSVDQVKRIVDIVNEVLGTKDFYVIAGTRKETDRLTFWDGTFWTNFNETRGFGMVYTSLADAQAALKDALKADRAIRKTVKIVPWANLFPHFTEIGSEKEKL